ncbi:hypothetical protein PENTCL1PPCAC_11659 [Pristionchus entomophagus]|uniref:Uncharacterized protein n=1 Tax=Pristionchus entomophagus TaxID=358040 RepID=A0AAV5TA24_9BILA|nr:hypothetical protein PENTCL1PPCAC_11659 [Pristionchus entomophagus]
MDWVPTDAATSIYAAAAATGNPYFFPNGTGGTMASPYPGYSYQTIPLLPPPPPPPLNPLREYGSLSITDQMATKIIEGGEVKINSKGKKVRKPRTIYSSSQLNSLQNRFRRLSTWLFQRGLHWPMILD